MADTDRDKWDRRYAPDGYIMGEGPKAVLSTLDPALPTAGRALDIACGEGQNAVWLARRGLDVDAVDISARGLAKAADLAERSGVAARVALWEHDLDDGLPAELDGYELVTTIHFRPRALFPRLANALRPSGLLLVEVLTVANEALVERPPRRAFLAEPGELLAAAAAAGLIVVWYCEGVVNGRGVAQLLAQRPPATPVRFTGP